MKWFFYPLTAALLALCQASQSLAAPSTLDLRRYVKDESPFADISLPYFDRLSLRGRESYQRLLRGDMNQDEKNSWLLDIIQIETPDISDDFSESQKLAIKTPAEEAFVRQFLERFLPHCDGGAMDAVLEMHDRYLHFQINDPTRDWATAHFRERADAIRLMGQELIQETYKTYGNLLLQTETNAFAVKRQLAQQFGTEHALSEYMAGILRIARGAKHRLHLDISRLYSDWVSKELRQNNSFVLEIWVSHVDDALLTQIPGSDDFEEALHRVVEWAERPLPPGTSRPQWYSDLADAAEEALSRLFLRRHGWSSLEEIDVQKLSQMIALRENSSGNVWDRRLADFAITGITRLLEGNPPGVSTEKRAQLQCVLLVLGPRSTSN